MKKLSDTQLVILAAACSRDDRLVLPLPASLKGGAANKVVNSLMTKGLVTEVDAGQDDPVWRAGDDDRRTTLRVTDAAFTVLNLEPHDAATGAQGGQETDATGVDVTPAGETPVGPTEPATPKVRAGTKQALLVQMLQRTDGATVGEIVAATGWQPHTVRGAMAGALKKRLGLTVTSEKVDSRGRVYRIES